MRLRHDDDAAAAGAPAPSARSASCGLVALAALATFAVTMVTALWPRSAVAQTVGDVGILGSVLSATVACTLAARRGGPMARGWTALAVAAGIWSAGHLLWTWYGVSRDHVYPFPSLADAGYVGYAVPAAVGLLLFPRTASRRFYAARAVLDAFVVASMLLFLSWATVLGSLVSHSGSGVTRAVTLAFPLVDVLVASMVLTLGMRVAPTARRPWLLLGSGLVLLAVTDSVYVSLTTAGSTGITGTPLTAGWMSAWLLVAFAGSRPVERATARQRHFTVGQELLPLAPALVAVVIASVMHFEDNPVLMATGGVALASLVAQQVVGALDKVRLANGLEEEVESRTAALRSAEARFGALVSSSDEAIVSKSVDGVVTSWNAAAEQLYGYAAEEIVGRPVELLVPDELREQERTVRERVARGDQVRHLETERVRRNGSRVPVALTVSPIREDGVVVGLSAIGHDITEQKRAEAELQDARTRALAASTAKSQFLATMSHEIRTPMNGVIGLTGLLLDTELTETQHRYAAGVRGAGEALLAIIDDILDFSKLEAGKVVLDEQPYDPRELVDEVGVLLGASAAQKGLELVVDCAPDVPEGLRGDPGRLRQVLINLAANAVKFTAAGEVVIRARVRGATGQRVVEYAVTDTGIGIDDRDRDRLFEPFSQADASTTRRFGGTGLGLAICRRLVTAMHGELRVESRIGAGSTFSFAVPLVPAALAARDRSRDVGLQGMRVLVVDDNATNRLVLHDQLRAWKVGCDLAGDAASGWQLVRDSVPSGRPYDVVLLDLCMPGVDGLQLATQISSDPATSQVPTVLLTSAGTLDLARLHASGVSGSIHKPVRYYELHDTLMQVAAGEPVRGADPQAPVHEAPGLQAPGHQAPVITPSIARVLVVEDNTVNQMVAEGVLRSLGYDVDIAGNGLRALEALGARDYAAVLMDCHMPEMDGFEATAELRRREGEARHTPVIAMTAGVLAEDRQRCAQAGMDDFVAKPIDVQRLSHALTRWIATSPAPVAGTRGSGGEQVLDTDRLDELRTIGSTDGWGVLPAVAEAFVHSAPADCAAVLDAGRSGDSAALQASLHRLRGAAANLGAVELARTCQQLETMLRNGSLVPAESLDRVQRDASRACGQLAILLRERS